MTQRVVIVGAGTIGLQIAKRLESSHQVLVLDTDERAFANMAEPTESSKALDDLAGRPGSKFIRADGTSRLVLDSLFSKETACALLATISLDHVNLEVCRVGKQVGFSPILALIDGHEQEEEFAKLSVTAIQVPELVAQQLDRSLKVSGAVVPIGVGLGMGELMEIRLVSTSPILHKKLKDLAPHRWRIAAVFRNDELIVPTGDTALEQDDRVLLVGDPKILPTVSEYLRLGTPQFPKEFGANVVTLEWPGKDKALADEARLWVVHTQATKLVRGFEQHRPPAGSDTASEPGPDSKDEEESSFSPPTLSDDSFASKLKAQYAGLIVCRSMKRTVVQRITQKPADDAQLCDRSGCPVLFARGQDSYRRILLPVSDSDLNIRAAHTAIDLSRQFSIPVLAINVDLPSHISGLAEHELHHEVEPIKQLCQLYNVQLDYKHHDGNPIAKILQQAEQGDLMVMARRFARADSYFNPDIALRVARSAPCSVLVLTLLCD